MDNTGKVLLKPIQEQYSYYVVYNASLHSLSLTLVRGRCVVVPPAEDKS